MFMIIGNWKMYKTPAEAAFFIEALKPKLAQSRAYLAVPFPALVPACEAAKGSGIEIGAQNLSEHKEGAYTGEVSAGMIRASGASFTLIGHSERRQYYGESDDLVHAKLRRAILSGLKPILCIGETENEREQGKTEEVIKTQLKGALGKIEPDELKELIVAYEPVWAIGTGKSASAEMANEAHGVIKAFLKSYMLDVMVLYGGSVKPENAKELLAMEHIDGALVGGASLNIESFIQIIED